METKDQILQRIKKSVLATVPEAKVVLFGSYARGTNNKDSDIDLLILIDDEKIGWLEEMRITYPLYDIEFDTGIQICLVVLSKKDWESKHKITPFYKNIASEGIILNEGHSGVAS